MVLKRQVAPAAVVPLQSLKTTRPQEDPGLEKAMAEIRKRAAAPPASKALPPATTPASRESQTGQTAAAGQGSAVGGGGSDGTLESYYAMLWSRIRGQWALPPGILSGDPLEAVIGIAMLRNGAVTAIHFEKRSGNRYFDDSALKAIEKATPFPPLPEGVGGKNLELGVRFHSAELRR
jgi:TonB family protein